MRVSVSRATQGAVADGGAEDWANLQLAIKQHSVHKVENADTEDREYVVSNLRTFNIEVVLVDESQTRAIGASRTV
mgnify:CR=1 FL=1